LFSAIGLPASAGMSFLNSIVKLHDPIRKISYRDQIELHASVTKSDDLSAAHHPYVPAFGFAQAFCKCCN
jgi:hypothetical protein